MRTEVFIWGVLVLSWWIIFCVPVEACSDPPDDPPPCCPGGCDECQVCTDECQVCTDECYCHYTCSDCQECTEDSCECIEVQVNCAYETCCTHVGDLYLFSAGTGIPGLECNYWVAFGASPSFGTGKYFQTKWYTPGVYPVSVQNTSCGNYDIRLVTVCDPDNFEACNYDGLCIVCGGVPSLKCCPDGTCVKPCELEPTGHCDTSQNTKCKFCAESELGCSNAVTRVHTGNSVCTPA